MTNSLSAAADDPNPASHPAPNPPPGSPPAPGQNPSPASAHTLTEAARSSNTPDPYKYRRPVPPVPIERYELSHPAVPASLDGLAILHITDLHVRKGNPLPAATRRATEALRQTPADLVFFTGDYMNHPGDEPSTMVALRELVGACRARLGVFGIFGNHDTWDLRHQARSITGITWLSDRRGVVDLQPDLRLVGSDEPEDLLTTLVESRTGFSPPSPSHRRTVSPPPLTLTLLHYPTEIFPAADFNLPLLFAGHTHAGQFRLTPRLAPHTSCDLPRHLSGGILRLRQTLCGVSRGMGNAVIELRVNCPPQIPLYVLRHGPLPAISAQEHEQLTVHAAW